MDRSATSPGVLSLALFGVAVLIGGTNFVAVRFSNEELAPFWGAGLRFSMAAVIFVVTAMVMRLTWPKGRQLALIGLYGVFTFTLTYALMYWALVQVSAGLAAVVLATVPLVTTLMAAAQRLEPLHPRALIGAVGALGGIVWMTVSGDGLLLPLGGLVAMLLASVTIAQAAILGKRVSPHHPVITNAVGMSMGAPLLLVISAIAGETWSLPKQAKVAWWLTYLVLIGSVGLFVTFLLIYRGWTASATSYAFVLFPVVTLLLETWWLDEPLTFRSASGALIVMAAVWFGVFARRETESVRDGVG